MYKDITFIINPSEITAGTRGASLGPYAVITEARKIKNQLFGKYPIQTLTDCNYLLDHDTKFTYAKNAEGLIKVYEAVSDALATVYSQKRFPFVFAGDHGSAGGTIAGIKKQFPDKRLGVVWIDAHGDIHSPYTTPSGNMHGMPVATALSEDNIQNQRNKLSEEESVIWNELKNLHGISPKVSTQDLVYVAVRDVEEEEIELINRLQIRSVSVEEVRKNGVNTIVNEITSKLDSCDLIYISFDVDSMDPEFTSHGTGTPVENGLKPEEAYGIMDGLLKTNKVACLEFVEINPCLDEKKNKMAEVAFDMANRLITNNFN
jgi:arginase